MPRPAALAADLPAPPDRPRPATAPPQLTRHATRRLQQRGIPGWFLELLVHHGKARHDGHGVVIHTVDQAARRRLLDCLGPKAYASAERYFGVYAVVAADDQAIVTAAHRTRRHRLH